jgi:4-amino-4-deoxy-L-arabinose transferase-like glycosyltransferase
MRYAPLALAVLCTLALFTALDRPGFTDIREARDAEVARELILHREPLTPLYANENHLEKPVLAYAPEVVLAWIDRNATGEPSPLRSRQVRAVLAVALVLLTSAIASRHFGARAGWWSALVLASTLGLVLAARTDGTQMMGSLLGWLGTAGLADAVFGAGRPRAIRLLLTYVALAGALVIAGPLPALWPLGGLVLFATLARDRAALSRVQPLAGLALMTGAALPWYGAMAERHGAAFLLSAASFPYATEPRVAWYAAPLLAVSYLVIAFYPWSSLMPEAMLHAATWWRFGGRAAAERAGTRGPNRAAMYGAAPDVVAEVAADVVERERREEGVSHFFICSLVAAIVPVALYPGAPLAAALPALPAAAMLCGRLIDHLFEDPERLARPLARAARMMAVVGSAGALLLAISAQRLEGVSADMRLLAAIAFITSWLPFLADLRGMRRTAAAMMVLPVALGAPVAAAFVLPGMEGYLNTRTVAAAMNERAPQVAPLALIEPAPPSLRLYCRHNLVVVPPTMAALAPLHAEDGFTYVAFPPGRRSEVAQAVGVPLEIIASTPSLVLARVNPGPGLLPAPATR